MPKPNVTTYVTKHHSKTILQNFHKSCQIPQPWLPNSKKQINAKHETIGVKIIQIFKIK